MVGRQMERSCEVSTRRFSRTRGAVALFAVLGACTIALLAAGPASAQNYPEVASLTVSRTSVPTCGTVVLTGAGYLPTAPVTVSANGAVVGSVTTNASGGFTFSYTYPATVPTGSSTFSASDGTNSLTAGVQVVAGGCGTTVNSNTNVAAVNASSGTTTGSTGLPVTGSDTAQLLVRIAILMIGLGLVLVLVVRGRGRRSATSA
jgi:hypothetical protein